MEPYTVAEIEDLKRENIKQFLPKTEQIDDKRLNLFCNEFIKRSPEVIDINKLFKLLTKKYKINPSKNQMRKLIDVTNDNICDELKKYIVKRTTRNDSGVLVVTITLPPHQFSCKHNCAYCPLETDVNGNPTQPRSYISNEPAMIRASRYNFDIRGQIWDRISCYICNGNIDKEDKTCKKLEVILSGGTWECYPLELRNSFIQQLYWGCNTYTNKEDREMYSIEDEIKINETTEYRIIGLTLETRPDYINRTAIKNYLRYGVTRIQLGVQHYSNYILDIIERGCHLEDIINAIKLLKQCSFKVVVHLMPDLPGSNIQSDLWMFRQALFNSDLRFDDVKIYPTAVIKSFDEKYIIKTKINDWYEDGSYQPYAENNLQDLIDVIKYFFINAQPWIRVQRCVRDIPANSIKAGYDKKCNLRQIIDTDMKNNNEITYEIRSREIGHNKQYTNYEPRLVVREYEASNGIEYFISLEAYEEDIYDTIKYYLIIFWYGLLYFIIRLFNNNYKKKYWNGNKNYRALYGFLRLRLDKNAGAGFIKEIKNTAMIREVHVYGKSLSVNSKQKSSQHKGYGKYLVSIAELIAIDNNYKKMSVIAGIGTREYYKNKCGYHLEGSFMVKDI